MQFPGASTDALKRRAERFGVVDQTDKKSKRAERFGVVDESVKQSKRADRFGISCVRGGGGGIG